MKMLIKIDYNELLNKAKEGSTSNRTFGFFIIFIAAPFLSLQED